MALYAHQPVGLPDSEGQEPDHGPDGQAPLGTPVPVGLCTVIQPVLEHLLLDPAPATPLPEGQLLVG